MAQDIGSDTALVTGASGWLGQGLLQALTNGLPDDDRLREPQRDLKVRCMVLPGESSPVLDQLGDRIEVVRGDIRDAAACAQLCGGTRGAVLFQIAGVIHPRRVRDFYQINVDGTKNILDAAAAAGVRRAVIVSSNSPCGCNPARPPF